MYVAPGPAACARAVKLEAPAHPPVRADGIFHRLILFHGAFRQLLPQYEHRLERLRRGLEQFGDLFFAQRVCLKAIGGKPVLHLLHGIGVVQHGQFLQPGGQFFPRTLVNADRTAHQRPVHADAPVVDLLVEMVLRPHLLGHGVFSQPFLNGHLGFHVAQVIGPEGRPLLRGGRGHAPRCILARHTEIPDEFPAFGELLLVQPQRRAHILEGQRQAEVGRPDHRTVPARRVQISHAGVIGRGIALVAQWIAVAPQPLGEAHALKLRVECPLAYALVGQRVDHLGRDLFPLGQIHDLYLAAVRAVAQQQDVKVGAFHVAVHR